MAQIVFGDLHFARPFPYYKKYKLQIIQVKKPSGCKKKNERIQFTILFSIIIIFVFCNIPRITLLVHQVIIIEDIKYSSSLAPNPANILFACPASLLAPLVRATPTGTWSWGWSASCCSWSIMLPILWSMYGLIERSGQPSFNMFSCSILNLFSN